ncbi:MAG: GDSL-type esterase/lipase family protein [Pseudomonadota bacterium]
MNLIRSASCALLALTLSTATAQTPAPDDLTIYAARPLAAWHIVVADFEARQIMNGTSVQVPKPANPKVPASVVGAHLSPKDAPLDALTLSWKDAWSASLRLEDGPPLDLRPYLAQGVLALDVNVKDMAQAGLSIKISCGEGCERYVPYLVAARALEGKGWQHLVFSMRCFARDGDDFSAVTHPFTLDASGTGEVAIANVAFQKTGKPNTSCPDYKTASVTPDLLNEAWSINWWFARHQEKLAEVQSHKDSQLLFIGDSITQGWEKQGLNVWNRHYQQYHALDLGFSGDRTENVLWRLQHGEVDGLDPKVAVLMFGTNNTGHRQEDPKTTAAGIRRNLDELRRRLPNTKILLLAIFPREEHRAMPLRQINGKINTILASFADNKQIFFLDMNDAFLDANGVLSKELMPDLLHPNERGYEIWATAMHATLLELMGSH